MFDCGVLGLVWFCSLPAFICLSAFIVDRVRSNRTCLAVSMKACLRNLLLRIARFPFSKSTSNDWLLPSSAVLLRWIVPFIVHRLVRGSCRTTLSSISNVSLLVLPLALAIFSCLRCRAEINERCSISLDMLLGSLDLGPLLKKRSLGVPHPGYT